MSRKAVNRWHLDMIFLISDDRYMPYASFLLLHTSQDTKPPSFSVQEELRFLEVGKT